MRKHLTIGQASRETGVPVRTIRFYEAEGVMPAASRTDTGYRIYSPNDVRRLRLVRNARTLGLGLPEVRRLVEQAFASDCRSFAPQLGELIAGRRADVAARIRELHELQRDLDELERHVAHAACASEPGQMVADCDYCPLIDEKESDMRESQDVQHVLDVLACEIGVRPAGAPTFDDVASSIESVERESDAIVIRFDESARETVAQLVAAEQKCCSTIGWHLDDDPMRLRITAQPQQLEVLESILASRP